MEAIQAGRDIERLLQFGLQHRLIERLDTIPVRNALMDLLKVEEPWEGEIEEEKLESAVGILSNLLDHGARLGIIPENTVTYRDLLDARIMGLLMPRQSEVVRRFFDTAEAQGMQKATDDFYALSQCSNYIRMDRIAKNLYWLTDTEYGDLEITINLSKPEKDPKEIAAAKAIPQTQYPKCLLCVENVGYGGHLNHPARQNHRVIPLSIAGENWYFQYSPYVYYNEHCIVFHEEHIPMKMQRKTFERLVDFVEQMPHYFIGSNADLPIVGGSILTHDHFQGGHHRFPMEKALVERSYLHPKHSKIKAGIVKWPMSVIRLSGSDKEELVDMAFNLLNAWKEYSDPDADLLAYSDTSEGRIPHNTITPIARKNAAGELEVDLVLRNNRTSSEYPDGIFHPHQNLHHIKKENIGLIEVMGLAVLPGRLATELKEIEKLITGQDRYRIEEIEQSEHPLHKHAAWIAYLVDLYGTEMSEEQAQLAIQKEVGQKFSQVLMDAGVYKRTQKGQDQFIKFVNTLGFQEEL